MIHHFSLVADLALEHDVSIILYNVPSRTGSNLEPDTIAELAHHPAIVAVKEASGNIEQVQQILDSTDRSGFTVLSGEDHLVAEVIRRGGTGVISASANRWPREFQVICELGLAGEHGKAAELQGALAPCIDAVFAAKNPIPLHHIFDAALRSPLVSVGDLREPRRSAVLDKINAALAIESFPHVATLATR